MCVCAYERERKLCVPFHVPEQRDGIRSQSLRCGPGMRRGGSLGVAAAKCFELELQGAKRRAVKVSEDRDVTESQARTCACGEIQ